MKLTYDPVADAAYLYLAQEHARNAKGTGRTRVVEWADFPTIVMDFDAEDRLVGLEFLNAKRALGPALAAATKHQ